MNFSKHGASLVSVSTASRRASRNLALA